MRRIGGSGALLLASLAGPVSAAELTLTGGGGSQNHADQSHTSGGIDYAFLRFRRSERQDLQIGVSYTWIRADTDTHERLWAVSVYPQLSLYPKPGGAFRRLFPASAEPFFFVRALGPSYLSVDQLGERKQSNHFAFQAQVGFGLHVDLRGERAAIVALSWKHFSNAELFDDNDGIDVPVVLSLGMKF
jgi:hypothetical protein